MPTGIYKRIKKHGFQKGHKTNLGRVGRKMSDEQKNKIGLANTGKKRSEEAKIKMSDAKKNNPTRYWLGKKRGPRTEDEKKRIGDKLKGRKRPIEVCVKQSISQKGEKSHFWNGGVSVINHIIRQSLEYRLWRESVFKRDNWTCQECGVIGSRLNAHHIKEFSKYPELRFDINNGITLCKVCHIKTDNWGWPKKIKYEIES